MSPPRAVDLIEKKRDGGTHDRAELAALIQGSFNGTIADYQLAAWLMAVYLRGMSAEETFNLTLEMAASGEQLDLSSIGRPVADKHSTGGVGDKTSLVVMPLVAACGVPVGKMSGRGLGFTGGTIDKLECFPGIQTDLSAARFMTQLQSTGIVITGQSADLAPADGRLYALRDVTATVPSIPLIASSVMSKKLAGGAQVIVLDVKTGSGAFMREPSEAMALARAMVDIGTRAGRRVAAVVSDMSQPLGQMVGNALEVREALDTLRGNGPAEFAAFAEQLASWIVSLATGGKAGGSEVRRALTSGAALESLRAMVQAQDGDARAIDDAALLPQSAERVPVLSPGDGFVTRLDALSVARASNLLGAGRERKGAAVDLAVGVELRTGLGQAVARGEQIAVLHVNSRRRLEDAQAALLRGLEISPRPPARTPLILERIGLPD